MLDFEIDICLNDKTTINYAYLKYVWRFQSRICNLIKCNKSAGNDQNDADLQVFFQFSTKIDIFNTHTLTLLTTLHRLLINQLEFKMRSSCAYFSFRRLTFSLSHQGNSLRRINKRWNENLFYSNVKTTRQDSKTTIFAKEECQGPTDVLWYTEELALKGKIGFSAPRCSKKKSLFSTLSLLYFIVYIDF